MRGAVCLSGTFFLLSTIAHAEDVGLKPLGAALAIVRATPGTNKSRDAGPELTVVKERLRAWIELQLPALAPTGDPAALAKRLNAAIKAAGMTCDDAQPPRNCTEGNAGFPGEDNARGYLGDVKMATRDYGRYLVVETAAGIRCGYDESAYIYEWRGKRWQLLLQSEQDSYGEKDYAPQNFLAVEVSADDASDKPPPLILTLGYSPWCTSAWPALYTRVWRASQINPSPKPLVDTQDTQFLGDDSDATQGRVMPNEAIVAFMGNSIDGDVLARRHVRHYLFGADDKPVIVAPVALSPADFVDEWLTRPWAESGKWSDAGASEGLLEAEHKARHKDFVLGKFEGPPLRCRADPTLWQVGFSADDAKSRWDAPTYYLVRWMAPYRFTMVAIQAKKYPHCDIVDKMPDALGTLFPLQSNR